MYDELIAELSDAVSPLEFAPPVHMVYNPLTYAREPHLQYLDRFGTRPKEVLFVGMNPGPWGMAQTGVPFGAVPPVRDWLKIDTPHRRPDREHPKRPIEGHNCARVEVSGQRLWSWVQKRFGTPERFADRMMLWNYCPLMFLAESGRNITPDKLKKAERETLHIPCDQALRALITWLDVEWVIGVGAYAEQRVLAAIEPESVKVGRILHPSPASPAANQGWAGKVDAALEALNITI